MTSKPAFKTTFAIIITAIFGYIMYLLIDSVNTGLFFTDESGKDVIILSAAFMGGPILLSIICCIIRKRYIGLLSILNLFLCASIGSALGEETTDAHIFVFAAMIIIPYILCLKMIIGEKKEYKSDYTPISVDDFSHNHYSSNSNGSLSFSEKQAYILHNCHSAYSPSAINKIENDPNLTASQKAELKDHLFYYGD